MQKLMTTHYVNTKECIDIPTRAYRLLHTCGSFEANKEKNTIRLQWTSFLLVREIWELLKLHLKFHSLDFGPGGLQQWFHIATKSFQILPINTSLFVFQRLIDAHFNALWEISVWFDYKDKAVLHWKCSSSGKFEHTSSFKVNE